MEATSRQTWAIFCASGIDVRNCKLTKDEASTLLSSNTFDRDALVASGGIVKREVAPKVDWQAVYDRAHQAGMQAGANAIPVPMVVQDDSSKVVKQWHVPDGVCGFAWVVVKPGTHSFARWAAKNLDAKKDYYGGVTVKWVGEFNQSLERKEAYARAFCQVLNEAGVPASTRSRMD